MSHSRVFEISTEPGRREMTVDSLPDWFFSEISDGAEDVDKDDETSDVEWFANVTKSSLKFEGKSFSLLPEGKMSYFKGKHAAFCEITLELSGCSLEDYSSGKLDLGAYLMKKYYDDKFGFYVYYNCELVTLDEFMRFYIKDGTVYHIGNIVNYHS